MKKVLLWLFAFAAIALFFHYGSQLENHTTKLADKIGNSPAVAEIKKEILTSEPLRHIENTGDVLTAAGVIKWTNIQRSQNGAASLSENPLLNQAAQKKVQDMFKQQYFEHESPQGKGPGDLAAEVHYEYISVGENLALGNFKGDQDLVEAWMNSPGHRANILNAKFQEIGVAVGRGVFEGKTVWLAVQEFGRPLSACRQVDSLLAAQIQSYKSDIGNLEPQISQYKAQLDSLDPKTKPEYSAYNDMVDQYNSLIKTYNNKVDLLKQAVAEYNQQVNSFNQCAAN